MVGSHLAVAHRVLVKLASSVSSTHRAALKSDVGAKDLIPIGNQGWYKLDAPGATTAALLAQLPAMKGVLAVEPDGIMKVASVPPPVKAPARAFLEPPVNDPDFGLQWALHNTGQSYGPWQPNHGIAGDDINVEEAWNLVGAPNFQQSKVTIADFDTGIDYNHPDLAANMWSAPAAYTISEGGYVYNCPAGSHGFNALDGYSGCSGQEIDNGYEGGHGTATAGIMGEVGNNDLDGTGINETASLLSLVVVYPTDGNVVASDMVTAIDALEQIQARFPSADIRVGNMSLASDGPGSALDSLALASEMSSSGFFFAAGTGNGCQSNAGYPAAFYLTSEVAVAASDQSDNPAVWNSTECTNGGGQIAAPGINDLTTQNDGSTTAFAGTSDATPHVAGSAALILYVCPLPPSSLAQTIENTGDLRPQLYSKVSSGLRLDVGNAVASCDPNLGHTQGSATVSFTYFQDPTNPDLGTVSVIVAGIEEVASYNTAETKGSFGTALATAISENPYVTAAYNGANQITVTTRAYGPYTAFSISAGVNNSGCLGGGSGRGRGGSCGPVPNVSTGSFTAGH